MTPLPDLLPALTALFVCDRVKRICDRAREERTTRILFPRKRAARKH